MATNGAKGLAAAAGASVVAANGEEAAGVKGEGIPERGWGGTGWGAAGNWDGMLMELGDKVASSGEGGGLAGWTGMAKGDAAVAGAMDRPAGAGVSPGATAPAAKLP